MTVQIIRLSKDDSRLAEDLNALFAEAFDDPDSYASAKPSPAYLTRILDRESVIVLAALNEERMVGGLVAYLLDKLEQERSEIYIYDLAVTDAHRRRGVATALIDELKQLAAAAGAWVIYVQADYGDEPAITLYEKLGTREDMMHFDILPDAIG